MGEQAAHEQVDQALPSFGHSPRGRRRIFDVRPTVWRESSLVGKGRNRKRWQYERTMDTLTLVQRYCSQSLPGVIGCCAILYLILKAVLVKCVHCLQ